MILLAAADSGAQGPVLVLTYIAQLAFGAFVYSKYPKRDDLPKSVHGMWLLAVWGGVVPCIGFALIAQIFYFITYRAAIGRIARHDQARRGPAQRRPADEDGSSADKRPPASGNPFL